MQRNLILFCLLLFADLGIIFFVAPEERTQGLVQKIFYFHVSSAFAMYAGFILAGVFSLCYLIKRSEKFDAYAVAGARVGLLFCTMVLVSGPIWARPIWGTWWTWDPRLTTTLLLWLIFMATVLLREFFGNDPKGRLYGAILTLFGILDIPLVFFAVKLWRGIHPTVLATEDSMPATMKLALIGTNMTVLYLFGIIFKIESRLIRINNQIRG